MKRAICVAALLLLCSAAPSPQLAPATRALLGKIAHKIEAWGTDPVIVAAVKAQNAKKLPMAMIHRIDGSWIAGGQQDLANELLNNAAAKQLRALIGGESSVYRETFVMDDQGANVAMTNRTSDYWQGDEAKWQKSFNSGSGALFVDEPAFDASENATVVQVSVPVMDGKRAIGAITVSVNADALAKRR